ncbi:dTDP-4-dehydrorhamnose 3,5-epimerase [Aestuariivirga litoralis]|uniref:dTDP-4-dehydrorhamnose 3,5-epimerase n=1 Tax=Aestuariivirga litoralis TaxID=2650924 RepID=UPI0018C5DC79|nr:dTDP-4-dehydrorhamnose 3,5-epimerase [Aestuariivirga litoralis]MBG1230985.1 dTDP-4-dehydrorhamnose 3,5-epimerase [Aestuariivirga litoralis]
MDARAFNIAGPLELTPVRHGDARGYFTETFNLAKANAAGVAETEWVQDNQSFSAPAFTLRGLHFQLPPFAQAKIVRVLKGRIFDVAVDLRRASKTFGQWVGVELSAEKFNQLYVPRGFAHGFLTLEPDVLVAYKVSHYYSGAHDRSLSWADASLGIAWPLPEGVSPVLSAKDAAAPKLEALQDELKEAW